MITWRKKFIVVLTESRYFSYDSNKLVIARCLAQCDQYFPRFSYFAVNKSAKYEKLRKYWSYCTRNRECLFSPRDSLTLLSIHGESHMNTSQGGRNRPRKKLSDYIASCYLHKF